MGKTKKRSQTENPADKKEAAKEFSATNLQEAIASLDVTMKQQAEELVAAIEEVIRKYAKERLLSDDEKKRLLGLAALVFQKNKEADGLIHHFAANLMSSGEGRGKVKTLVREAKVAAREAAKPEDNEQPEEPEGAEIEGETAKLVQEILSEFKKKEIKLEDFDAEMSSIVKLQNRQEKVKALDELQASFDRATAAFFEVWERYDINNFLYESRGGALNEIPAERLAPETRRLSKYVKEGIQIRTKLQGRITSLRSKLEEQEQDEQKEKEAAKQRAAEAEKRKAEMEERKKKTQEQVGNILEQLKKNELDVADFESQLAVISQFPDSQAKLQGLEELENHYKQLVALSAKILKDNQVNDLLSNTEAELASILAPLREYVNDRKQRETELGNKFTSLRTELSKEKEQEKKEEREKVEEFKAGDEVFYVLKIPDGDSIKIVKFKGIYQGRHKTKPLIQVKGTDGRSYNVNTDEAFITKNGAEAEKWAKEAKLSIENINRIKKNIRNEFKRIVNEKLAQLTGGFKENEQAVYQIINDTIESLVSLANQEIPEESEKITIKQATVFLKDDTAAIIREKFQTSEAKKETPEEKLLAELDQCRQEYDAIAKNDSDRKNKLEAVRAKLGGCLERFNTLMDKFSDAVDGVSPFNEEQGNKVDAMTDLWRQIGKEIEEAKKREEFDNLEREVGTIEDEIFDLIDSHKDKQEIVEFEIKFKQERKSQRAPVQAEINKRPVDFNKAIELLKDVKLFYEAKRNELRQLVTTIENQPEPASPEPTEQPQPAGQAELERNIRKILNEAKLAARVAAGETADPDKIAAEAALADSQEILGNEVLKAKIDRLIGQWSEFGKLDQSDVQELANLVGFSPEQVKELIFGQENVVKEMAVAKKNQGKSWKKQFRNISLKAAARIGIYTAIGAGIAGATGGAGLLVGLTVAGTRVVDRFFTEGWSALSIRRENKKIKKSISESDSAERNIILQNIATEIAFAKQVQIDGQPAAGAGRDSLIEWAVDKSGETENEVKSQIRSSLLALMEVDAKRVEMEEDAKKRNAKFFGSERLAKLCDSKALAILLGENQSFDEKITSTAVLSVAGIFARSTPVVGKVLLGLAGMKIGGAFGKVAESMIFGKKDYQADRLKDNDALLHDALQELAELKSAGNKRAAQQLQEQIDLAFRQRINTAKKALDFTNTSFNKQAKRALGRKVWKGRGQAFIKNACRLAGAALMVAGLEMLIAPSAHAATAETPPSLAEHVSGVEAAALPLSMKHVSEEDAKVFIDSLKGSGKFTDPHWEKILQGLTTDQQRYNFLRNQLNLHDKSGTTAWQFDQYLSRQNLVSPSEAAASTESAGMAAMETPPAASPEALAKMAGLHGWLKTATGKVHFSKVNDFLNNAGWAKHEDLATIHKGEGIEHALIRQLKEYKSDFGFKGKPEELNQWAGAEAHRLAIKLGYVDPKSGAEIRIGSAGIDKSCYLLTKDIGGNPTILEYLKGKFGENELHKVIPGLREEQFEGTAHEAYEYVSGGTAKAAGEAAAGGGMAGREAAEAIISKARVSDGTGLLEQHSAAFRELNHQLILEKGHGGNVELAKYSVDFIDNNKDGIPDQAIFRLGDTVIGKDDYQPGQFADLAAFTKYTEEKLGEELATAGKNIDDLAATLNLAGNRTVAVEFITKASAADVGVEGFDYATGIQPGSAFETLVNNFNSNRDLFVDAGGRIDPTQFRVFKELGALHIDNSAILGILSRTKLLDNYIWAGREEAIAKLMANPKSSEAGSWIKQVFGEGVATESARASATGSGVSFSNIAGKTVAFNFNAGIIKVGKGLGAIFGGKTFKLDDLGGLVAEVSSD